MKTLGFKHWNNRLLCMNTEAQSWLWYSKCMKSTRQSVWNWKWDKIMTLYCAFLSHTKMKVIKQYDTAHFLLFPFSFLTYNFERNFHNTNINAHWNASHFERRKMQLTQTKQIITVMNSGVTFWHTCNNGLKCFVVQIDQYIQNWNFIIVYFISKVNSTKHIKRCYLLIAFYMKYEREYLMVKN